MTDFRDTLKGILAMLACCLFFIINDTLVKALGESMPVGQILFVRGLIATVAVGVIAWRIGALDGFVARLGRRLFWRTVGEVGATVAYISALMHLPIANASAIAQAAPLMITAAGAVFLKETVGWRRWTAVAVGFGGILLIVRPGADGFNGWALLALASVTMIVLRDVLTRFIPATTPTLLITTVSSGAVTLTGGLMAAGETWVPFGLAEAGVLAAAAAFILGGYVFVIVAMRHGDVSIVAPFRYSFIPYSIVLGWLVWGDVPDGLTFLGIAVVVATGLYTFWRERRRALDHTARPILADPAAPTRPEP